MNPTKAELRRSLKQARLALSPDERQVKSTEIVNRLWQAVDWSTVASVHCFEPVERLGEVDISDFITSLQTEYPSLQIFTTRQVDDSWVTVSLDGKQKSTPMKFDVIIVPMLGFDQNLQRLGYGYGFYDRFLATQPDAQKIGLCFDLGRLERLPVEPHDIPQSTIITESTTYCEAG